MLVAVVLKMTSPITARDLRCCESPIVATPRLNRMMTNHPWAARRAAAYVLTITLLAVLTAAQSPVCVGQVLPAPTPATPAELPPGTTTQSEGPKIQQSCDPAPSDSPLFMLTADIRPRMLDGKLAEKNDLPINCSGLRPVQQQVVN